MDTYSERESCLANVFIFVLLCVALLEMREPVSFDYCFVMIPGRARDIGA